MAEPAHIILKRAREAHEPKMQQWRLGQEIGASEDTIKRWEGGIKGAAPDPDDVKKIEEALGATGLWHEWMIAQFDSYRDQYTKIQEPSHAFATVSLTKYKIKSLLPLLNILKCDAMDGRFDDMDAVREFRKEGPEAVAAIQKMMDELKDI